MPVSHSTAHQVPTVCSLTRRDRRPELMDDPALSDADHDHALRGLAKLNRAAGIEHTVLNALKPFLNHQPLRVLDVAAGSGDLITALARRTAASGFPAHFTGCDISDFACQSIRKRASKLAEPLVIRVDATRCDVLHDQLPKGYDIVMCHLFLHHLGDQEIVRLLRTMRESASKAVIITDLRRTRRGYVLAWLASRLLTRSRVVHTDALLSVRGALTTSELHELAISAGYGKPCMRTVWPQRMLLTWQA